MFIRKFQKNSYIKCPIDNKKYFQNFQSFDVNQNILSEVKAALNRQKTNNSSSNQQKVNEEIEIEYIKEFDLSTLKLCRDSCAFSINTNNNEALPQSPEKEKKVCFGETIEKLKEKEE